MKYLLFLLLLNVSCAPPGNVDPRANDTINPDFLPYVLQFEEYFDTEIIDIPIGYDTLNPMYLGVCSVTTINGYIYPEILISKSDWDRDSEYERLGLIFHELGHCHFGLDHLSGNMNDGCAISLMNDYRPSHACLVKHWDYYINEFKLNVLN